MADMALGYGSEYQLLRALGHHRNEFFRIIQQTIGLPNDSPIEWIDYPTDDPYRRLLKVEVEDSSKGKYQFDETYPYLDNSWNYKWNDFLGFFVKWGLVGVWNRLHFGLRVKGKKNVKPFKEELKNGALCVCNHVYVFDAMCVYQAFHRFRIWIPMYPKHFNGKSGWFVR